MSAYKRRLKWASHVRWQWYVSRRFQSGLRATVNWEGHILSFIVDNFV